MGSKQTTLIISNQTAFDIVKIETLIESTEHWDGSDNPENNFNSAKDAGISIPRGQSLSRREELNSPALSSTRDGAYVMTLHFSNGEHISFRNCQKDALDGYNRTNYWLKDGSSDKFSLHQYAGNGTNQFEVRRIRTTGNNNWMKDVTGNPSLMKMSIPGTHDSGCYSGPTLRSPHALYTYTQDSTIREQLDSGIRYFDLRGYADGTCQKYEGQTDHMTNFDGTRDCQVCHDVFRQPLTFKIFFNDVIHFLSQNPSEVVLVQIKKDAGDKDLADIMVNLIADLGGSKHFYEGRDMPNIDTVRGRIVLVSREGDRWGFNMCNWGYNCITDVQQYAIQDVCQPPYLPSGEDYEGLKLEHIINFHNTYAYKPDKFLLNFISLATSKTELRPAMSFSIIVNKRFLQFLRNSPSGYHSVFLLDGVNHPDAKSIVNLIINNNL